jgi:hypothetical protein
MPDVLLVSIPKQRRSERDAWHVVRDGVELGTIETVLLGRHKVTFYTVTVQHDDDEKCRNIGSFPDCDRAIAALIDFHANPERYRGIHWR